MLKQLLTTFAIGSMAISAMAAESQVVFTYAGSPETVGAWGKSKAEIYDVAIRIADPALAGKKIKSIRAVLNAYEGIDATSLWLSKDLTLDKVNGKKVNVPDTYADSVAVEAIAIDGIERMCGELRSELETPYEITEEGIYVGYTLNVTSPESGTLTDMQKQPILLSKCTNPESFYLHTSRDVLKWTAYNASVGGGAAMIYVTLEGEFPEYSVGVKGIENAYASLDKDFYVTAELSNIGSQDIKSLGYTYRLNGVTTDAHLDLAEPLQPSFTSSYSVQLPINACNELGSFDLDLTLAKVNGEDNKSVATNAKTTVNVLPYVPVHRPLLEEFTGTWCGWCTRGYIALELLNEEFGDDVVLAAYHNGDAMTVTNTYPVNVSGFPSGTLNRNDVTDPYYGYSDGEFGMKDDVIASIETIVPADIQLEATWANEEKTEINVTTKTRFFENKENAGLKVGYLLINNGLCGETSAWNQSNYYAGATQYAGTPLEELTTWPSSVSGLIFNDVVVDVNGMRGVANSIPSTIVFNEEYTSDFSYNIANNSVIQDKDKLYVAAFIINPNGTILNANKANVIGTDGVNSITDSSAEVSAEYYSLSGMRVATPAPGLYIKVAKMSDGSTRTSKVLVK